MDNKTYKDLQDMFAEQERSCVQLASQYVEQTCR